VGVFTEEDFYWDKKIAPYKRIIIAGVNKIHRGNSRCKDIDPMSAYLSTQGTKTDPVFFVTCGEGANVSNVYFSTSEVEQGKEFCAAAHLAKSKAIDLCESYAKSNATHPSTVDFSRVQDLAVREHPNGRTTGHLNVHGEKQLSSQMAAFVGKAVQTQRKGGKYEAAGFGLIVLGMCLFCAAFPLNSFWMTPLGGLFFVGGLIVFLIGRFM
jgi:hypothetical protein